MKVKVRDFETIVGDVEITGKIQTEHFVVSFYGVPYLLAIVETGLDRHGQYAFVEETMRRFSDGFEFSLELEPSEDGFHGCQITFKRRDAGTLEQIALQQGINPNAVNLLIPPRQLIAVCLDHLGQVDGSVGPVEQFPCSLKGC